MHTPAHETRSSHQARVPVVAIGPGGQFVMAYHARGGALVLPMEPAPPPPGMLRRRKPAARSARPHQPWDWLAFWRGVVAPLMLILLAVIVVAAVAVALILTPVVVVWRKP